MPVISERISQLEQSSIRSLVPFKNQAQAKGIKVLHLNIGQPDIPTLHNGINAIQNIDKNIIEYGPSAGQDDLRQAVSEYYTDRDLPISKENVLVTTGASEAIMFTLFSCLNPGDNVIILEPFYANYLGFAQVSNVEMITISRDIDNQFELPSISKIRSKINKNTKAIFLCNPCNPTGNLYSKSQLIELKNLVLAYDLYLIVDEVYSEFCYDVEFTSVLEFEELTNHVVVIDSISKAFSACGARIGFIISRNILLIKSILKLGLLRLCPPALGQTLALACLTDNSDYLKHVKNEYRQRRDYLYFRLSKIKGVKSYLPKAAFYILVELPVNNAEKFCKWLLTDFSHQNHTVMFAPGSGFYENSHLGNQQIRIAFILDLESLAIAMDCLEIALELYPDQS